MARRLSPRQLFEELINRLEPRIAAAFRAAIDDIRRTFDLQRVIAMLEVGRIEEALDALGIDEQAFDGLQDAIRDAYNEAGKAQADNLPRTIGTVRFSGRNPRAEAILSEHSAGLVRGIVREQRQAIREALTEGMVRGAAPRSLATSIVGRVSRVSGQREGGIIGLSAPQARYVTSARAELETLDENYFTRTRRDRRFDRTIRKAQREGTPLPAETIAKAITSYERRLLETRGRVIGRTEALSSLNMAQYEALRQAVDSGAVRPNQIRRIWRSASDIRVRDTHAALNGDTVGLDEAFVSPSGARLMFPGDPSAPASERVACRCWSEVRIDRLTNFF